ncbi:MAG: iron-containing alcohol dehydrogenase, partial [Candidatus Eiseniibacteriota bacterium]
IWAILSGTPDSPPVDAPERLAALLEAWVGRLEMPRLGRYGVLAADVPRVVAGGRGGSTKTNPIALTDDEMAAILHARL